MSVTRSMTRPWKSGTADTNQSAAAVLERVRGCLFPHGRRLLRMGRRTTGSAASRAATPPRIRRVEGGYARPDLPRRGRLRSPGSAASRAATLARICCVEGGDARPDLPRRGRRSPRIRRVECTQTPMSGRRQQTQERMGYGRSRIGPSGVPLVSGRGSDRRLRSVVDRNVMRPPPGAYGLERRDDAQDGYRGRNPQAELRPPR